MKKRTWGTTEIKSESQAGEYSLGTPLSSLLGRDKPQRRMVMSKEPKTKETTTKRPCLTWNSTRDETFVELSWMAENYDELTAMLKEDERMEIDSPDLITAHKVAMHFNKLKKEGVDLPKYGRRPYKPNVKQLNVIAAAAKQGREE